MKWYVIPSLMTCGLNCTLAFVVLSLATFHLYTDKSTNAPVAPNEEWINQTTGLIPFSVIWAAVSMLGIFASMVRNRIWIASSTLSLLAICFGVSMYFVFAFGVQLEKEMEEVPVELLVNITYREIIDNKVAVNWIPGWLDNIQKQSKQCCGINTYRDYQLFWSEAPTRLPRSCCRDEKVLPSPCPSDLTHIPFPHTPAIFFKVETGCMEEINESIRIHIQESFQNCIIMSIFIAFSVLAFLLLFVKRYLVTSSGTEVKTKIAELALGCDTCSGETYTGEAIPISSQAYQGPLPAIDSFDGGSPYTAASVESVSAGVSPNTAAEPTPPTKEVRETSQYLGPFCIGTRASSSGNTPKVAPIPKTNAAFAALQKQPEAATGDDMTIGAGNMGRHEVFLAQDVPLVDTPFGRIVLQSTNSADDIGDVVHGEEERERPSSPPGSPGGRRKKVRKTGMAHHSHKNKHTKEP